MWSIISVSYTHLDVYKRQPLGWRAGAGRLRFIWQLSAWFGDDGCDDTQFNASCNDGRLSLIHI